MSFDEWLQQNIQSGRFKRGGNNAIYVNGFPVSTAQLQQEYAKQGGSAQQAPQAGQAGGAPAGSAGVKDPGAMGLAPQQFDPKAFTLDTTNSAADRAYQTGLVDQLRAMANGTGGPSLAQLQLQQATGENLNNAMALGAAQQGQGMGGAAALRNIGQNQAQIQQQSANQSAQLRAMEQMHAQQLLASLLGGVRGQDLQQSAEQLGANVNLATAQYGSNAAADANQAKLMAGVGQAATTAANAAGGAAKAGQSSGGGQNPYGGFYPPDYGSGPDQSALYNYPMSSGGPVPGYAPGGPVDSPKNDVVPAMLSPMEIVLPRSVTLSSDAPERAKSFVEAIMQHQSKRKRGAR